MCAEVPKQMFFIDNAIDIQEGFPALSVFDFVDVVVVVVAAIAAVNVIAIVFQQHRFSAIVLQ